ncbi:bleomycin resistance protein [Diaphorobacter caeni]|uniref:bleomycin resistance protein n=1 Tax=Diaphorobacter caeni TaxID=2784387 RepID=UPI00188E4963|nr:VOC family protein [Diaphorobacter caeni]MBF5003600.1 VOC family protein [Diaphorobacter caeni]
MASLIHSTVPVLPSPDLAVSEAFYVQILGFQVLLSMPGTYLIVAREGCEIHFWPCGDNTELPRNSSCYVRADTDALHADFAARGLTLALPQDREWGMRELYVIDPHGNLLKFGEPV